MTVQQRTAFHSERAKFKFIFSLYPKLEERIMFVARGICHMTRADKRLSGYTHSCKKHGFWEGKLVF